MALRCQQDKEKGLPPVDSPVKENGIKRKGNWEIIKKRGKRAALAGSATRRIVGTDVEQRAVDTVGIGHHLTESFKIREFLAHGNDLLFLSCD